MAYSLIGLVLFTFLVSQDTVYVYRTNTNAKIFELEDEMLRFIETLYNRKHKPAVHFKIVGVPYFYKVLERVDKAKEENDFSVAGMSGITVTEERKKLYDFSKPYLLVREAVFGSLAHTCTDHSKCWKVKGTRIAYSAKTLQEIRIKELEEAYGIIPVSCKRYQEKEDAVVYGKADFFIGDNITKWYSDKITLVHIFEKQYGDGFGIAYPKGSPLKHRFDEYIEYFAKSPSFLNRIDEIYGNTIGGYYRKYMKQYYNKKFYEKNKKN